MKRSLLAFVGKHARMTLVVVFAITAFFLYHASFLTLDADYASLMVDIETPSTFQGGTALALHTRSETSVSDEPIIVETEQLTTAAFGSHIVASSVPSLPPEEKEYDSGYLVLVESPDLYRGEILTLIEKTMDTLTETGYVSKAFSVLDFVTLEKRGSRLVSVPFSTPKGGGIWSDEDAQLLKKRLEADPIVKGYLVSDDLTSMVFTFKSFLMSPEEEAELSAHLDVLREAGLTISTNGASVLTNRLMYYLSRDLTILLSLCFVAILTIYYLSFRAKRSVLLPFSMSVIGIIWTFGTMRLLGYTLNIINIVTPCMVLNLGSSYAIHVIGEYYTDYPLGYTAVQSTQKILRTIIFACLTTVIGFASLLFSKTSTLRHFGIIVGIGVTYCAILAATYLVAQLSLVTAPKKEQIVTYKRGYLAQAVLGIDHVVRRSWKLLFLLFLLVIGGYLATKDHISVNTNYMSYMPKRDPFYQSSKHFASQMGGDTPYIVTIEAPAGEEQFFLKSTNLSKVHEFERTVASKSADIRQILSFASYVSFANKVYSDSDGIPPSSGLLNLLGRIVLLMSNQNAESIGDIISADGNTLTIYLQNSDAVEKDLSSIGSAIRIEDAVLSSLSLLPSQTTVTLSGEPHRAIHFSNTLLADQHRSTIISYILVFVVVLVAFKSLSLALYSLVPILYGVMANYIFMYIFKIPFDMITVSFSAVAIGAGIDDAIHFLIRYKNKIGTGLSVEEMISTTIKETGRPIILTSLSIVGGMMMFLFASYTPVRYFGTLMAMALLNCMLATLFVMPSTIRLITALKRIVRSRA